MVLHAGRNAENARNVKDNRPDGKGQKTTGLHEGARCKLIDTDHGGTEPMRRTLLLAAAALVGLAGAARADGLGLHKCCPTCNPIPCPDCPDCSCPCDHRLPLTLF